MHVDKAGIADIDDLVELRLAYLSEDHGGLEDDVAEAVRRGLPDYYRAHLGRDLLVFVVRDGGTIVSCAFLLVVEKPLSPAFINGRTGTVLNVYTRPTHRRRGYARQIMEALLAEARELCISPIELKATEDGYPLYRAVGFDDDRSKYHPMTWTRA